MFKGMTSDKDSKLLEEVKTQVKSLLNTEKNKKVVCIVCECFNIQYELLDWYTSVSDEDTKLGFLDYPENLYPEGFLHSYLLQYIEGFYTSFLNNILILTKSSVVLGALRIAIKTNLLKAADVSIIHISPINTLDGETIEPKISLITCQQSGQLNTNPGYFLDTRLRQNAMLLS